jgi:hypothetical protein
VAQSTWKIFEKKNEITKDIVCNTNNDNNVPWAGIFWDANVVANPNVNPEKRYFGSSAIGVCIGQLSIRSIRQAEGRGPLRSLHFARRAEADFPRLPVPALARRGEPNPPLPGDFE